MNQATEQYGIALGKAGEATTAFFRAVLLTVKALCGVAIKGLDLLDSQLKEHQRPGATSWAMNECAPGYVNRDLLGD